MERVPLCAWPPAWMVSCRCKCVCHFRHRVYIMNWDHHRMRRGQITEMRVGERLRSARARQIRPKRHRSANHCVRRLVLNGFDLKLHALRPRNRSTIIEQYDIRQKIQWHITYPTAWLIAYSQEGTRRASITIIGADIGGIRHMNTDDR